MGRAAAMEHVGAGRRRARRDRARFGFDLGPSRGHSLVHGLLELLQPQRHRQLRHRRDEPLRRASGRPRLRLGRGLLRGASPADAPRGALGCAATRPRASRCVCVGSCGRTLFRISGRHLGLRPQDRVPALRRTLRRELRLSRGRVVRGPTTSGSRHEASRALAFVANPARSLHRGCGRRARRIRGFRLARRADSSDPRAGPSIESAVLRLVYQPADRRNAARRRLLARRGEGAHSARRVLRLRVSRTALRPT